MTTDALKHNFAQTARFIALAPVLLAALIGCIPLIIPCIACRCCKGIFAKISEAIQH